MSAGSPVLQRADADVAADARLDPLHRGAETLHSGDAGDVGADGRRTDLVAVDADGAGSLGWAERCGDPPGDVAVGDQLDGGRLAVRARAVEVLADDSRVDAVAPEHLGGALRGQDLEAEL